MPVRHAEHAAGAATRAPAMRARTIAFVGAVLLNGSAAAAGIDSRVYTCADLHGLVAARGFVFISQPAFGDFVVSSPRYCGGGDIVQLRSVPTADRPECTVNYCMSKAGPP